MTEAGAHSALPDSPYKGLAPFDDSELDERFFFGREREIELVAANLMASRLTVLYGASGVGKSSLLRAGVVRRLRSLVGAGGAGESESAVVADRWRDDPVAAIASAAGARSPEPGELLADLLAERVAELGGELYLILDQMEEYFLYHGREHGGGRLADELAEVLSRPELRVHVLLGIRDDSLSALDAFKARLPALFANVVRLDHLDRAAARRAIVGPLEEYARFGGPGVAAEPALVEAVLDEVATGRIEQGLAGRGAVEGEEDPTRVEAPYLQLVLERLWHIERERGSDVLRAETLAELGGASRIVEEHLARALSPLDAGGRDLAARLFNYLVTPSGTKIAHSVEDLARYADAENGRLRHVLRDLVTSRIVRPLPARNGGAPRYEIFHDVLADAVLAWRTRYETERALDAERAAAQRRHRRLAAVAGVALVALAAMALLTVYAFAQRERADDRARTAKARELTVAALGQLTEDPQLSVLLALEAARRDPTADVESALRQALVADRARRTTVVGVPLLAAAFATPKLATVAAGGGTTAAVFSPDGRWSATADGSRVRVQARDGRPLTALRATGTIVRLAAAREAVAAAAADGTVVVAGLTGSARFRTTLPNRPTALALSPDGERLVAASGKIAYVTEVASGRRLGTFEGRSTVLGAALSPDGSLLATAAQDGAVRIWSVTYRRLSDVLRGHSNVVRAAAFTPDGQRLVTGSADRTGRIWRVDDGHEFGVLVGHDDEVRSVALSRDGRLAVTASADGTARVWDARGDPELEVVRRFGGEMPTLARVQDGAAVVRVGRKEVYVDLRSGRDRPAVPAAPSSARSWRIDLEGPVARLSRGGRELVLRGHLDRVNSAKLSPGGGRAVTASDDHDVRIWSTADGDLLRLLKAHVGRVADARFGPDGRWIVTAGPGAAGIWDANTGQRLFYVRGHEGPLTGAAFAPDARTVVTTGADGTLRSYRCDVCGGIEELAAIAERRLAGTGRRLTDSERRRYLGRD